jgi:hypothetical protein
MKKAPILIVTIALLFCSCEKDGFEGAFIQNPEFEAELRSSPDTLIINDYTFHLQRYLWRDFMPPSEENGSKMFCVNKLTESDEQVVPESIELVRQYVLKGSQIWPAEFSEIRTDEDCIIEGFLRDGPKWGPNIEVDIVCEFKYLGKRYRVMAKAQMIHKTS